MTNGTIATPKHRRPCQIAAAARWRAAQHQAVVYLTPAQLARLDKLRLPGEARGTCIKRLIAEAIPARTDPPAPDAPA